jgi:hypothetical protein
MERTNACEMLKILIALITWDPLYTLGKCVCWGAVGPEHSIHTLEDPPEAPGPD